MVCRKVSASVLVSALSVVVGAIVLSIPYILYEYGTCTVTGYEKEMLENGQNRIRAMVSFDDTTNGTGVHGVTPWKCGASSKIAHFCVDDFVDMRRPVGHVYSCWYPRNADTVAVRSDDIGKDDDHDDAQNTETEPTVAILVRAMPSKAITAALLVGTFCIGMSTVIVAAWFVVWLCTDVKIFHRAAYVVRGVVYELLVWFVIFALLTLVFGLVVAVDKDPRARAPTKVKCYVTDYENVRNGHDIGLRTWARLDTGVDGEYTADFELSLVTKWKCKRDLVSKNGSANFVACKEEMMARRPVNSTHPCWINKQTQVIKKWHDPWTSTLKPRYVKLTIAMGVIAAAFLFIILTPILSAVVDAAVASYDLHCGVAGGVVTSTPYVAMDAMDADVDGGGTSTTTTSFPGHRRHHTREKDMDSASRMERGKDVDIEMEPLASNTP